MHLIVGSSKHPAKALVDKMYCQKKGLENPKAMIISEDQVPEIPKEKVDIIQQNELTEIEKEN